METTKTETEATVAEALASLNEEFYTSPAWKRHTSWGQERLAERQRLMLRLDELRAEARRLR